MYDQVTMKLNVDPLILSCTAGGYYQRRCVRQLRDAPPGNREKLI